MKKYFVIGALLALLITGSTPVLSSASSLTVQDQVALLAQSQTPIEDFSSLPPETQAAVLEYFRAYGIPASVNLEYSRLFPVSRIRSAINTDLFQQTVQFLGCVSVASMAACITAKNDAETASSQAQTLYPLTLHNGVGDAFRHCLWSALMTLDLGASTAWHIGTQHENDAPGPANERAMDLANNATGRALGSYAVSRNDAKLQCKFYADAGVLVTLY